MATTKTERMLAVVVRPSTPQRLVIENVDRHPATEDQLTVRVTATSLNRGEVVHAFTDSATGTRIGWDFVGIVEQAAAVSDSPAVGDRVVGLLPAGAWAQWVNVAPASVALIPDGVSDSDAATLPVAGLTALLALRRGGSMLGRRVLIDGASGGVGRFAVQLAAASGAQVFAHVRREADCSAIQPWCNGGVVLSQDLDAAAKFAPYHLIVDSVGGATLGAALTMLADNGTCVTLGASSSYQVPFDSGSFVRAAGATLQGLMLFADMAITPAGPGLRTLLDLTATGAVRPAVTVKDSWTNISQIARALRDREFSGKAVLAIDH